jgi:hypothetical protein
LPPVPTPIAFEIPDTDEGDGVGVVDVARV